MPPENEPLALQLAAERYRKNIDVMARKAAAKQCAEMHTLPEDHLYVQQRIADFDADVSTAMTEAEKLASVFRMAANLAGEKMDLSPTIPTTRFLHDKNARVRAIECVETLLARVRVAIHVDSMARKKSDDWKTGAVATEKILKPQVVVALNATDKKAANYIRNNPGCKGDSVAVAAAVTSEHFRSRIFPKLKRQGFYNKDGYRPPSRKKPKL